MKINFENSWAPQPGFEPRIFSTAGRHFTSKPLLLEIHLNNLKGIRSGGLKQLPGHSNQVLRLHFQGKFPPTGAWIIHGIKASNSTQNNRVNNANKRSQNWVSVFLSTTMPSTWCIFFLPLWRQWCGQVNRKTISQLRFSCNTIEKQFWEL